MGRFSWKKAISSEDSSTSGKAATANKLTKRQTSHAPTKSLSGAATPVVEDAPLLSGTSKPYDDIQSTHAIPPPPEYDDSRTHSTDNDQNRTIPSTSPNSNYSKIRNLNSGSSVPKSYADSGYESNGNGSRSVKHIHSPVERNLRLEYKLPPFNKSNGSFLGDFSVSDGSLVHPVHRIEDDGNVGQPEQPDSETRSMRSIQSLNSNLPSKKASKRMRFGRRLKSKPAVDQLKNQQIAPITQDMGQPQNQYIAPTNQDKSSSPVVPTNWERSQPVKEQTLPSPHSTKVALPPLSILEGYKINKKGKILDEEGELIGELVKGDLLDCVRQKARADGKVIDEYGRVVGTVRTIAVRSPVSSPTPPPMQRELAVASVDAAMPALNTPAVLQQPIVQEPAPQPQQQEGIQQQGSSPAIDTFAARERAGSVPSPDPTGTIYYLAPERRQSEVLDPSPKLSEKAQNEEAPSCKDFAMQEAPRRAARSAADRSYSDLSKTYARPSMSPVPENIASNEKALPDNPSLYSFKGDVPTDDTPQRKARSRSPNVAINSKAALALGQANNAMFANMPSGPYAHGGRMGPRRATTHFAGSYGSLAQSQGSAKSSMNSPFRPSPLSSHNTSPKRSDTDSNSDDGRPGYPGHKPMSIRSVTTNAAKTRTYFTHGGKLTVDLDAPPAPKEPAAPKPEKPAAASISDKKRGRLSLSFRRKDNK